MGVSKPIVRRRFFGNEVFSKRIRSSDEMAALLRIGSRRAILQLQGVLFFGNADSLSNVVNELLKDTDMVLLDLHGISDIDVSGVTILENLIARAKALGKTILLCNLPKNRFELSSLKESTNIVADLDSGLEWMEEKALIAAKIRPHDVEIPFNNLELMREFTPDEAAEFEKMLTVRNFKRGDIICHESDNADRMWILTKGTVSVWLNVEGGRKRIASLAAGTTIGEMALLQTQQRSATVSADENISTYELNREKFERMLEKNPMLAFKLLNYFTHEMARRLKLSHQDLRATE
jgi:anti-anti-sigma regulatory factor